MAPLCLATSTPCLASCHPDSEITCGKGEYLQADLGEFCVNRFAYSNLWENVECETHCPAACEWSNQKACSMSFDQTTGRLQPFLLGSAISYAISYIQSLIGCPKQDVCRPNNLPCQYEPREIPVDPYVPSSEIGPCLSFEPNSSYVGKLFKIKTVFFSKTHMWCYNARGSNLIQLYFHPSNRKFLATSFDFSRFKGKNIWLDFLFTKQFSVDKIDLLQKKRYLTLNK